MKKGSFTSIADIALAKLGFNSTLGKVEEVFEDIFKGKNTGKETSLYAKFRDYVLSNLFKTKGKQGVFYKYDYENGEDRELRVFT